MATTSVIYMLDEKVFYFGSIIPISIRICIIMWFRRKMKEPLGKEVRDSDAYRGFIYAFLAISTAVLFALTISNAKSEIHLNDAVITAVISFVGFYVALSIQTYKFNVLAEQVSDG